MNKIFYTLFSRFIYFLFNDPIKLYKVFNFKNLKSEICTQGAMPIFLDSNASNQLNVIMKKISSRTKNKLNNYLEYDPISSLSLASNQALSINSVCTNSEYKEIKNIFSNLLLSQNDLLNYFELDFNKLRIYPSLLSNKYVKDRLNAEGPQSYHRDELDSIYKGIKVFIPYDYEDDDSCGVFSYIPLSIIPRNKKLKKERKAQTRYDGNLFINKNHDKIKKLKSNSILAIDTISVYHRGGNITKEGFNRLILCVSIFPKYNIKSFKLSVLGELYKCVYLFFKKLENILRTYI